MPSLKQSINAWWATRLRQECQLTVAFEVTDVAVPHTPGVWYTKITTDTLYRDFVAWNNSWNDPPLKSVFMMHFYVMSGAGRGRTRIKQTEKKAPYVALFADLKYHRDYYERHNQVSENTNA